MKNVLVASTKGGVGKSTISNEIAYSLERTSTPFNFFSIDPQGNALRDTSEDPDAVISVIDTPGYVTDSLPRQIAASDVIVIPTLASVYDRAAFEPLLNMTLETAPNGSRIIVVVNRWTRWSSSQEYTNWIKEQRNKGKFFLEYVPNSDHVPMAGFAGFSAMSYACGRYNHALADPLLHLLNAVRFSLGLSLETKEDIRSGYRAETRRREEDPDNNYAEEAPNQNEEETGGN